MYSICIIFVCICNGVEPRVGLNLIAPESSQKPAVSRVAKLDGRFVQIVCHVWSEKFVAPTCVRCLGADSITIQDVSIKIQSRCLKRTKEHLGPDRVARSMVPRTTQLSKRITGETPHRIQGLPVYISQTVNQQPVSQQETLQTDMSNI